MLRIWWAGVGSNDYLRIFSPLYTPSIRPTQIGANKGLRTPDLLITSELLYQLSYVGNLGQPAGSRIQMQRITIS